MLERRTFLAAAGGAAVGSLIAGPRAQAAGGAPSFFTRGLPGPGHDAIRTLAGKWRVEISLYMALGSPDKPAVSTDIVTTREWIDGGRFLQDLTVGKLGDTPYWRLGHLGYDNMGARYQWVTMDGINADMMIYQAAEGSGPHLPISMAGTFVDQGVLGEKYAGKTIGQRTEIIIHSPDQHIFDIYFTPPGEPERLADHHVYTRLS